MFSNRKLTIQTVILGLAMMGCASDDNIGPNQSCLTGQGNLITETFTLGDFSSIAFAPHANLLLTQGATQSVVITGQSNVMDELIVRVINDQLQIETDRCVRDIIPLEIEVTIPDVEALSMAGIGSITTKNALNVDELTLDIAGVGEVTLMGEADNFDINIAGVGEVYAFDFSVNSCQVDIAGQADIEVTVSDVLNVNIAGSGTVFYKGDPTIDSNVSGSGTVVDAN